MEKGKKAVWSYRLTWGQEKRRWVGGVVFPFLIAAIGMALASLPGLDHLGPLACAILLAVLYRHVFGYPVALRSGIQFVSKYLLRLAIVLFGLKLNIAVLLQHGWGLVFRDLAIVVFAIFMMVLIGKIGNVSPSLSLLLGIGTGVCGAAAIAAVSPILQSDDEDTALSIGMIALVGTVFSIGYTLIRPLLPLSSLQYGAWSGMSLHEIAHVALAGAPAGQEALALALLAKLGRVLWLAPLSFVLMYWKKTKANCHDGRKTKVPFPWFLLGFIVMSLFGSYVLGNAISVSPGVLSFLSFVTSLFLTAAMVGLGLNVDLRTWGRNGWRPLAVMCLVSLGLSLLSLFLV
ncbi:YeiH family protein [Geobacillus icigianus]|uniref:Sulfate exporter family transporter n=1 Tax=Geobacillus icigianus TaxID=1430331 RepID=A0ABU6BBJ4_9BACL|nr:putative sulfate exporter family transporter [Geobacillus icigianus]MEB3749278.1 hypothetical protein [Geobacillus icigianus]